MFEIGEKIFYPMHGAGVIVDIQEKEILNQVEKFYVAKMPGEVKLMLPVKSAENLGLRPLVSEEEASGIISSLLDKSFFMPENWTERYNGNKEKLKTGDLHEIADIYKGLSVRNNKKNTQIILLVLSFSLYICVLLQTKNLLWNNSSTTYGNTSCFR